MTGVEFSFVVVGARWRNSLPRGLMLNLRASISEYRGNQLIELINWISSDGQLRADDQIIDEIVPVLGFSRRGVRIEKCSTKRHCALALSILEQCERAGASAR